MVLTSEGKKLLSEGELRFVYFALFDDEVDYDPYISQSGSMNSEQLSGSKEEQTENCLVREATTGYKMANASGSDFTNVHKPLFTMPQGSKVLPRLISTTHPTGSLEIETKVRKHQDMYVKKDPSGGVLEQIGPIDAGYERFEPSHASLQFGFRPGEFFDETHREGILIRVFKSGSDGLVEISEKRDSINDISYQNDVKLTIGELSETKVRASKL